MLRFWPMVGLFWVLGGCATYDITGRWVGPLPITDGEHCRIKVFQDGHFDFVCGGDTNPAGQGLWSVDRRKVTLKFNWLEHNGQVLKEKPTDMVFDTDLRMNVLTLRAGIAEPLVWKRKL